MSFREMFWVRGAFGGTPAPKSTGEPTGRPWRLSPCEGDFAAHRYRRISIIILIERIHFEIPSIRPLVDFVYN